MLAMLLLWGGHGSVALANGTTYYAKVSATASPTGAGTVYASTSNDTPKETDYKNSVEVTGNATSTQQAASITFYLFAKPSDGYVFQNWTSGNTVISNSKNITQILSTGNSNESNPAVFNFTANFVKAGDVVVASNDDALGVAGIDNPGNTVGQTITLTATNDKFASQFDHWEGPDGAIVSDDNPYTFVVTEGNKGTYTAVFNPVDVKNQGVYCYIGNIAYGGTKFSGRFLGLMGISETSSTVNSSQRYTNNSLMLGDGSNSDRMHSSPAFVLKLTGTPDGSGGLTSLDAQTQGHKLSEVVQGGFKYTVANSSYGYLYGQVGGLIAYFTGEGNNGRATQEGFGTVLTPGAFNKSSEDDAYRWQIYPIIAQDKNIGYFGAWPRDGQKIGDKYYTTMYAAFPYRCLDGVRAYYVSGLNDDGTVKLTEIESGIVPKNTPVILSCETTKPVTNRLLPLVDESQDSITGNLLKGEIWLKDVAKNRTADNYETYRTKFDPSAMRVLSFTDGTFANVNNSDILDNGKTGVLTYIENNTAYLSTDNMTDEQKALFAAHDTWKLLPDNASLTIDGSRDVDNWSNGAGEMQTGDVTFTRTINKAGGWYTLCLPFDISETQLKEAFGDDVDLEEFESADENDAVTFNFHKVSTLRAGRPYLIRTGQDFTSHTFTGVTISGSDVEPVDMGNGYTFQGTAHYNAEDIADAKYGGRSRFLNAQAELVRPSAGGKVLPTRCFFLYPEGTTPASAKQVEFSFDNVATAISSVTIDGRTIARPDNRVFTLTGQYVGTDLSVLPRGIYIVNGKKVLR